MITKYTKDFAYDALMKENDPLSKQFDSGFDGMLPECRSCRFHRPLWKYETCIYKFCPYSEKKVSTRREERKED